MTGLQQIAKSLIMSLADSESYSICLKLEITNKNDE